MRTPLCGMGITNPTTGQVQSVISFKDHDFDGLDQPILPEFIWYLVCLRHGKVDRSQNNQEKLDGLSNYL